VSARRASVQAGVRCGLGGGSDGLFVVGHALGPAVVQLAEQLVGQPTQRDFASPAALSAIK
jgi:hypothetical protein